VEEARAVTQDQDSGDDIADKKDPGYEMVGVVGAQPHLLQA
jgi:hypothetical protein